MSDPAARPKLRLGLVLWTAGMIGSASITAMVLPQLLAQMQVSLPAPLWVISLAGLAQSALLVVDLERNARRRTRTECPACHT